VLTLAFALLLQASPPSASIESMAMQRSGPREELVIVFSSEVVPATVRQEGNRVVVETTAVLGTHLGPVPPIGDMVQEVRVEPATDGPGRIVLRVADGITYEVERDGRSLRLGFGRANVPSEMASVYGMLFPGGAEVVEPDSVAQRNDDPEPAGYLIGRTALRPAFEVLLSTGTSSFAEGPVPVPDSYLEARPRIETDTRLALADLMLRYELRWRTGSEFEETNTPSHLLDAGLSVPVGTRLAVSANHHHFWGRAEAYEADPGGELYYSRETFRKHITNASLAFAIGPVTRLVANGFYWHVGFDSPTTEFFDHIRYGGSLDVRREVGPSLTADLGVGWEKIPTPDGRPLAAATARNLHLTLRGEPTARLVVDGTFGLERRTTPNSPLESDPLALAVAVKGLYQFTATSAVEVQLGRGRHVSAYEQNPYYTAQHARVKLLTAALPLGLQAEAAIGAQSNTYPVPTVSLGAAREDTIVGWSVSLTRTLRKLYARLDYTWNRRRSNVPDQSFQTDSLIVTFGILPYPDPHPVSE
jgi:hypothetical protein